MHFVPYILIAILLSKVQSLSSWLLSLFHRCVCLLFLTFFRPSVYEEILKAAVIMGKDETLTVNVAYWPEYCKSFLHTVSSSQTGASVWKCHVHCVPARCLCKNEKNFKHAPQYLSFDLHMISSFSKSWHAGFLCWSVQAEQEENVCFVIHCKNVRKKSLSKRSSKMLEYPFCLFKANETAGVIHSIQYIRLLLCQIRWLIYTNKHRSVLHAEEWVVLKGWSNSKFK